MAQARGRRAQLLLDFESTFGQTPGTPAAIRMPFNSSQLRAQQNLTEDTVIRNRRDPAPPTRGNIDVSGQVVVPLDVIGIGYWLKAMFGDPVTTDLGAGSGPYEHEFKPGDTQLSLVLEQGFTDIGVYELFNGCKVSRFSLTAGGDAELTASIDIMGAKDTVDTVSFASSPTDIALSKFNNFQASIEEGGSPLSIVTEMTLDIDFALDGDQYPIGSNGIRGDIPEGILQISGSVTAFFESQALLDKAINGTETSLKLAFDDGANILEFFLPEVQYERTSAGIEGPQGVRIELPYRAYFADSAESTSIIATLTNTQTTY